MNTHYVQAFAQESVYITACILRTDLQSNLIIPIYK